MADSHSGQCFCGEIKIEVEGEPAGMGYCHCESCRQWSAGPVNAFTLWPPEKVRITDGEESLRSFAKTDSSERHWCDKCGGHVLTRHPGMQLVDVYAALLPSLPFRPGVHVNYSETVLAIKDGLPKLRDFPAELGGSGEVMPE